MVQTRLWLFFCSGMMLPASFKGLLFMLHCVCGINTDGRRCTWNTWMTTCSFSITWPLHWGRDEVNSPGSIFSINHKDSWSKCHFENHSRKCMGNSVEDGCNLLFIQVSKVHKRPVATDSGRLQMNGYTIEIFDWCHHVRYNVLHISLIGKLRAYA